MGGLISRFRAKPSTKEVLEKLQSQVDALESSKRDTMAWHKKLIGWMLAYFSLLYLLAAGVVYVRFFHHPEWQDLTSQAVLWVPFLVAPFLFLLVRRVLTWWYHRKVRKDEDRLKELRKKRKKILDEVMETETYKVAKEILEKFAPEQLIARPNTTSPMVRSPTGGQKTATTPTTTSAGRGGGPAAGGAGELRRRFVPTGNPPAITSGVGRGTTAVSPLGPIARPAGGATPQVPTSSLAIAGGPRGSAAGTPSVGPNTMTPANIQRTFGAAGGPASRSLQPYGRESRGVVPGPPLPRPVLPRERGYMDRMVEYLVGDGPSNRYALICKQCQSHNGMALKEEFEYIAYRCCYCYFWNPARKQRPVAPKLQASPKRRDTSSDSSEDDKPKRLAVPAKPETASSRSPSASPNPRQPPTALPAGAKRVESSESGRETPDVKVAEESPRVTEEEIKTSSESEAVVGKESVDPDIADDVEVIHGPDESDAKPANAEEKRSDEEPLLVDDESQSWSGDGDSKTGAAGQDINKEEGDGQSADKTDVGK